MLRYLRNDSPAVNRSLLLKLEGTTAARDAIGARVEIRLKDQPEKPLTRTVKFGEGFLGQSSRWLHFGLGTSAIIEVRIHWPGGKSEVLKDCRPGTAITVIQGEAAPHVTTLPPAVPPSAPSPLSVRPPTLGAAVTLSQPALFPQLPSVDPDGNPWIITDTAGPVLVNLFASWCPGCTEELTAWRDAAEQFKTAGLSVALLAADGRDTAHSSTPAKAFTWLKHNRIPFPAGALTDEAFRRLTTAHRQLFGAIVNLPIPTSFLLDGRGSLAAIYRGPVSRERILADVAHCQKEDAAGRTAAALPYRGRWLQPPDSPDPSFWLNDLVTRQFWDDAFAFFQRHTDALRPHKDFAVMAAALSAKLAAAGRPGPAIAACEAALSKAETPEILNNLAGLLATVSDKSLRNPARALSLAQKAVALTAGKIPAILDTLAAAQAATGDFKAAADTAVKALTLARTTGDTALIPLLEKSRAAFEAGRQP